MKKTASSRATSLADPDAFAGSLLDWFRKNGRRLPWRVRRNPYRVWISELMLQQTRVETVIDYYPRFLKTFPTVRALADAPLDDVLKAWEGLGYYRRARHAHKAARMIRDERGGRFPSSYDELRGLPGVGPYTAAAVASIAGGERRAVVDGNVERVMARLTMRMEPAGSSSLKRKVQSDVDALIPADHPGLFNEAMMELGAVICIPSKPRCTWCPVAAYCRARSDGKTESIPVKAVKRAIPHRHVGAGIIVDRRGRILIARRKETSMLGGLWEFPGGGVEAGESVEDCIRRELQEELGLDVRVGPRLITVPHAFSHFTMDLHAHWVRINRGKPRALHCDGFKWVTLDTISQHAMPKADLVILEKLRSGSKFPDF